MRLKTLLITLALVILGGTYFYAYNKGSDDQRLFSRQVILPLCYVVTPDVKEQLALCLEQNL